MTSPQNPDRSDAQVGSDTERTVVITRSVGTATEGDTPAAETPATVGESGGAQATGGEAPGDVTAEQGSAGETVQENTGSPGGGGASEGHTAAGADQVVNSSNSTVAPPPWQRPVVSGRQGGSPSTTAGSVPPGETNGEQETAVGADDVGAIPAPGERTTVQFGALGRVTAVATSTGQAGGTTGATPSAVRRPGRGPRRASLQIKRVDPWSVLKLALVLSLALFFVWLVAVGVLYGVLDGMGVWDQLNGTYNDLVQGAESVSQEPLISAGRVFGVASLVGAVNIVLFTALATVGAFVYNVSADLVGGVEVTLSERE
ncbi:MAG TPA: DUF3566 domain-containing protein [Pseudonocardiaceae bacterium]